MRFKLKELQKNIASVLAASESFLKEKGDSKPPILVRKGAI